MKTTKTIAIVIFAAALSSCGLITPDCTDKDHTWTRWQQPVVRGRGLTDDFDATIVRRRCATCGWVQERKSNPCGL